MTTLNPPKDPAVLARMTGVWKSFVRPEGTTVALSAIDFEIRAGRLIGLFGNNGAGKTTLTRLITGTLSADRGCVEVGGFDLADSRASAQALTGLCAADERSFYPRLSGRDNLRLFGELRGLDASGVKDRIARLCEELRISNEMLAKPFQSLSSGERQRLNVVRGMLHEPAVLVVDEALRSADPDTVDRVSQLLCDYVKDGEHSILYTGHEFQGVEDLCDEIAVLDHGQLLLHGPREKVLRLARPTWRLEFDSAKQADEAFGGQAEGGTTLELGSHSPGQNRGRIAELVQDPDAGLRSAEYRQHCSVRELLKRVALGEDRGLDSTTRQSPGSLVPLVVPDRESSVSLLRALWRRDRLTYMSYPLQVVLQAGVMLLWAGLIFSFTRLLEPNSELTRELFHGDGFSFVILGVAFLHLGQTCLSQMGSQLREEQLQGTLEIVLTSGRSPLLLLMGSLTWPLVVRSMMTAFMLGASALWLGAKFDGAAWGAFGLATLLTCLAFTAFGVLSAAFVLAFKRGDPIGRMLAVATLLVGGTYFPVESLPAWLRPFGEMHPMTHGLRAARLACLEGRGLSDPSYQTSMGVLCAITLVVGALACWGYRRALTYARRTGGLSQA